MVRLGILTCIGAALLGGCAAERARDPFTATGELVALSGGDAGAHQACIVCHGLQGQGDGELAPRLAGLSSGYLQKQLQDYADGRREHPQMAAIARALDASERQAVAGYYARMAWTPRPQATPATGSGAALYHQGDPERGLPPCSLCHGASGEGAGQGGPALAGQSAEYLSRQLELWRASKRRNDAYNAMLTFSRRLSPEEIEAVSAYAASLSGSAARPSADLAAYP